MLPVECSSCTLIRGNDVVASYGGTYNAVACHVAAQTPGVNS